MILQLFCHVSRNASPSMRDAIQGMLTMSQMGDRGPLAGPVNPVLSIINNPDPFEPRPRPAIRLQREQLALKRKSMVEDESGEKMPTCYKDDEYGKIALLLVWVSLWFNIMLKISSFHLVDLKIIRNSKVVKPFERQTPKVPSFSSSLSHPWLVRQRRRTCF